MKIVANSWKQAEKQIYSLKKKNKKVGNFGTLTSKLINSD